ncbi:MAG: hypothetical protein OXS35_02685 [Dehalococcoidia bacterium]|nr:hypothetical protein [Dehalococcoidia bacterium]
MPFGGSDVSLGCSSVAEPKTVQAAISNPGMAKSNLRHNIDWASSSIGRLVSPVTRYLTAGARNDLMIANQ